MKYFPSILSCFCISKEKSRWPVVVVGAREVSAKMYAVSTNAGCIL